MSKASARQELLALRRDMSDPQRAEAADAIAMHVLAMPLVAGAHRIACYLSMASEPGTAPLIAAMHDRGVEVVVPISLPDHTLGWAAHDPGAPVERTSLGIPEPAGPRLGPDALASCSVVIVPALAVDHAGHRLGRGGGYYDRALAAVSAPLCALVYTHELVAELPYEPHDVAVQMAVTPAGLFRVP